MLLMRVSAKQSELLNAHARAHIQAISLCGEYVLVLALDNGGRGVEGCTRWEKESTNKKVKQRLMQINSSDLCIANWYLFIYSFLSCVCVFSFPFVLPRWDLFFVMLAYSLFLLLLFKYLHRSIRRCSAWDTDTQFRHLFVIYSYDHHQYCVFCSTHAHALSIIPFFCIFIFFCCQHTSSLNSVC